MTSSRQRTRSRQTRFGMPAMCAALLHGGLVALALLSARAPRIALPPVYRVELVAAPAGERAIGVVTDEPAPPPAAEPPRAPPRRAESTPKNVAPTRRTAPARKSPARATPTPDARSARRDEPAPKAGGGPEGGRGTDVANVNTGGIEFPFPAYLQNIVRQIQLRFKPRSATPLSAEFAFIIRRDGSVSLIGFRRRSGSYGFDLEAQGAIEAAANARVFGPLPDGFSDDALTVIFSFDPRLIR
jgi:outer membrane biosynthesis protein TonB